MDYSDKKCRWGRDAFKKELLLDIEEMQRRGFELETIIQNIKIHLIINK